MDLLKNFQQYIKKENLFQPADKLLLAVSGGVDSVVLSALCKQAGYDFVIAHCNFQLRGEASNADESLVEQLAKKYGTEFLTAKFDTERFAEANKLSIQAAARKLRYEWFAQVLNPATSKPFRLLLTAHHLNDNIETLLMNFFKGTGISGLQGILPKNGSAQTILRPLLFAKKELLYNYANEHGLTFREDASNESNKYTRNYFRNVVIPAVKVQYPQAEDNLSDNIKRFHEINILYQQTIRRLKKKLIIEKNGEYHLPVLQLLNTAALQTVLHELTREYNFTPGQITDIIKLLHSDSGKRVDSSTHRIFRNRAWLIISKAEEKTQSHFLIGENDKEIRFSNYKLTIEKKDSPLKPEDDPFTALLDAADIKFPLLLRKWKQGDYLYPLGMRKKKKVSRFLIDKKLSLVEKENVWVVEMDRKLLWLAGLRIDDRFKITEHTKLVLKLVLSPAK